MIYLSSDFHLGHNREFIYKSRGFDNIDQMNETIISNFNKIITNDDDLYLLGDIILGDNTEGISFLNQLNGNIHIIRGNHDTDTRVELYKAWCPHVIEVGKYADILKIKKYTFYLSHYPTLTANLDDTGDLHRLVINLYGHTHQKSNFYQDIPMMYHVGVDSHNCYPVSIEEILSDINNKINECKNFL